MIISRRIGRFRRHQRAGFEARALVQRMRGSEHASIFQKYLARARARARAPTVGARLGRGPPAAGPSPPRLRGGRAAAAGASRARRCWEVSCPLA